MLVLELRAAVLGLDDLLGQHVDPLRGAFRIRGVDVAERAQLFEHRLLDNEIGWPTVAWGVLYGVLLSAALTAALYSETTEFLYFQF